MKIITPFILLLFICSSFIVTDDYLEWSPNRKLTFSDFKAKMPKGNKNNVAQLTTVLSYKTSKVEGQVPQIIVYSRVNRSKSWIAKKSNSILESQQVHFDVAELYARKIRKDIAQLRNKNITDVNVYKTVIKKHSTNLDRVQYKHRVDMTNHEQLFAIWKKDVADSLKIYKDYTK